MGAVERIAVRAVSCVLGGRTVLRKVTADFSSGTITFIEGPNGAGKSTLLSVIGCMQKPSSGEVVYLPQTGLPEDAREELGWLGHEARVYRDLTSRENVELAARLAGVDAREGWARVASRLGIEGVADQVVATLSRGQRQRVALARALVHAPTVLLLDEPVTGLDAEGAERIDRLLLEERERGTIVIVVSHSQNAAERVGARQIRLERGRVMAKTNG